MLHRVYVNGDDRAQVVKGLRALDGHVPRDWNIPPFPEDRSFPRVFSTTIADLGSFEVESYPAQLDAWCRATLVAYGAAWPKSGGPISVVSRRGAR